MSVTATDEQRAITMTGDSAETLADALDQWENERAALAELFDENQALTISFRRYDITMTLAEKLITALEMDAAMFITQKTRDKIEQFREQMRALEKRRAADRQNVVDANQRSSAVHDDLLSKSRNKPAPIEDFVRDDLLHGTGARAVSKSKKNIESDDE